MSTMLSNNHEETLSNWSNKPLGKCARTAISRAQSKVVLSSPKLYHGKQGGAMNAGVLDVCAEDQLDKNDRTSINNHSGNLLNHASIAREFLKLTSAPQQPSSRRVSSLILTVGKGGPRHHSGKGQDLLSEQHDLYKEHDIRKSLQNKEPDSVVLETSPNKDLYSKRNNSSSFFSKKMSSFGSFKSIRSLSDLSYNHNSFRGSGTSAQKNADWNDQKQEEWGGYDKDQSKHLLSSLSGRNVLSQSVHSISTSSYQRSIGSGTSFDFLLNDSSSSIQEQRLEKVGKYLLQLVDVANNDTTESSDLMLHLGLQKVLESYSILADASNDLKVPKVRFGKTDIEIPVVTFGCMKFQRFLAKRRKSMSSDDRQSSFENVPSLKSMMKYAVNTLGMNHIETVKACGCPDGLLQIGQVLQELCDEDNIIKREDLIIQTKINPMKPKEFRKSLEASFVELHVDYIDLFTFHGLNMDYHFDMVFDNPDKDDNLIDIIREYQHQGKIKHIGFSSHGQPDLIRKLIETDQFDYCNIHYDYFGSYTASGGGKSGGNLENITLMKEKDMGVSVICESFEKGGYLSAPSKKLRSLTFPDLEPIAFGSLWLWAHEELHKEKASIHTLTVGAIRPSDLDETIVAAYMFKTKKEEMLAKVKLVAKKLNDAQVDALGEDWVKTWYEGVPNCQYENDKYMLGQIVSLYNLIKAFGMLDYAKHCYESFDKNTEQWDVALSTKINIARNKIGWGFTPGIAVKSKSDFLHLLQDVPEKNKFRVVRAIEYVDRLCSTFSSDYDFSSDGVLRDDFKKAYNFNEFQ